MYGLLPVGHLDSQVGAWNRESDNWDSRFGVPHLRILLDRRGVVDKGPTMEKGGRTTMRMWLKAGVLVAVHHDDGIELCTNVGASIQSSINLIISEFRLLQASLDLTHGCLPPFSDGKAAITTGISAPRHLMIPTVRPENPRPLAMPGLTSHHHYRSGHLTN
jgi:hypothetical protein